MHGSPAEFLERMSGFLGGYYLALAVMNGVAAYYLWHFQHRNREALIWTAFAGVMVILSPLAMSGSPPDIPHWIKGAVNQATGPVVYSVGTTAILAVLFVFRRFVVQPMVA